MALFSGRGPVLLDQDADGSGRPSTNRERVPSGPCAALRGDRLSRMGTSGSVLRWGLIGCGDIARKRVAPALRDGAGCELVAVERARAELAEGFAREFGARRWHEDWSELVRDPEIDAVYVATPVDLHARNHRRSRGGPARALREADGPHHRAVPRDDRRLSRQRRAARGRLLPSLLPGAPQDQGDPRRGRDRPAGPRPCPGIRTADHHRKLRALVVPPKGSGRGRTDDGFRLPPRRGAAEPPGDRWTKSTAWPAIPFFSARWRIPPRPASGSERVDGIARGERLGRGAVRQPRSLRQRRKPSRPVPNQGTLPGTQRGDRTPREPPRPTPTSTSRSSKTSPRPCCTAAAGSRRGNGPWRCSG